jgi:catechol 2,3-dioxygenase-like lactoylglutathione lyase family enzyme
MIALVVGALARPLVAGVDGVSVPVSDLGSILPFYVDVLGFVVVEDRIEEGEVADRRIGLRSARRRVVALALGSESLALVDFLDPEVDAAGRPIPLDARSNDESFQHVAIIVSDLAAAHAHLVEHGVVAVSRGPQRLPDWNPSAGGIEAFYFRDPDHHVLEILSFPPGKGDPRWQAESPLFLGIDHTAIVARDTERSLGFWQDRLGLRVAGASENHGPEQEALNDVLGARLRITALRAAEGPGVELLEYLSPADGRPMPSDTRPNDLWRWTIDLTASPGADLDRVWAAAVGEEVFATTPGVVDGGIGLLDPDRHAVWIGSAR